MKSTEIQIEKDELCIQGTVHFDNVLLVCQKGISLMHKMEKVKVNLKGLLQSDSSALALFSAWVRESLTQKKEIVFIHVPDFMKDIIKVCGLEGVLPISWES